MIARRPAWGEGLIVLAAAALVYLPLLGAHPFRSTEPHRVVPAWELMERGELLPTTLFERIYARKPPGMPWAIAASSSVFGQNEFAARLPSAIATAVLAMGSWFFAMRWFGRPWSLAAGLAGALTPMLWLPGRSAEIESLLFASTAIAAFGLIETTRPRGSALLGRLALALGLLVSLLAKGPAGLPVLIATAGACVLVFPRERARWAGVLVAAIAGVAPFVLVAGRMGLDAEGAATQGVDDFTLRFGEFADMLAMPFVTLATLLPASLALLLPWGPDARREAEANAEARSLLDIARVLAIGCLGSIALALVAGLSNPRYALPAVAVLPPLIAYAARGAFGSGFFLPHRAKIARVLFLGHPAAWPIVLLIGAAVWIFAAEPDRAKTSAYDAAVALGPSIEADHELWADTQIDTRPELFLYLEQQAGVRVLWRSKPIQNGIVPDAGSYLVLRGDEAERYAEAIAAGTLVLVTTTETRGRELLLFRAAATPGTMPAP